MKRREIDVFCDSIKKYSHQFKKMMKETGKDDIERLVYTCSSNSHIELSDICIGDFCRIPEENKKFLKCERGEKIGSFHTHPSQERFPAYPPVTNISDGDIISGITENEKFICMGAAGTNFVRCYSNPFGMPRSVADKLRKSFIDHEKNPTNTELKYSYEDQEFLISTIYNKPEFMKERNKNSCNIILDK